MPNQSSEEPDPNGAPVDVCIGHIERNEVAIHAEKPVFIVELERP